MNIRENEQHRLMERTMEETMNFIYLIIFQFVVQSMMRRLQTTQEYESFFNQIIITLMHSDSVYGFVHKTCLLHIKLGLFVVDDCKPEITSIFALRNK